MKRALGAAIAATTLMWASSASALIAFHSLGDAQVLEVQHNLGPAYRDGAFSIQTTSPLGQTNVAVSFDREGWMTHHKYDWLDAFVALGELPGVLTIDGQPAKHGASSMSYSVGDFIITYSGEPITVRGKTFVAGDELLRTRFRQSNPFGPYVQSDFFEFVETGVSLIDVEYLNKTVIEGGFASGISGYVAAPTPEPATWAMMIIGFGGAGVAIRRTRKARPKPRLVH